MTQTTRQFIVDEHGERTAVILPIKEYLELLDDVEDLVFIDEQKARPTDSVPVMEQRPNVKQYDKSDYHVNQYTAIIRQSGSWWIGWMEEVPSVICQEATCEELLESLRTTLQDMLELYREEALVEAGDSYEKQPILI